ncbi:hypothetical protein ODZ83_01605 [Acaricomes phytoseiuli]|uniref:hypothetical protein n=1 Tax=Acaricomes phytoseiuli TaxID=291968 RepID=UPI00222147CE|nr:hypothetical protein [Acaricomes phytoseiuli]MCW1248901.1 hypothetical protein [Acaricomes phytoseiuli]
MTQLQHPDDNRFDQNLRFTLARAEHRGELRRIKRGYYLPPAEWQSLTPAERHLLMMRAVHRAARRPPLFCRGSAALAWNLPLPKPPRRVSVWVPYDSGLSSTHEIQRQRDHALDTEGVLLDELRCTGLAATVLEIAAHGTELGWALAAADNALARGTRCAELNTLAQELSSGAKRRKAAAVLKLADARSGSVGESLSRASIILAGFPPPELQARFDDARGLIGYTDFFWPGVGVVGEFDGKIKYADARFRNGRSSDEVVVAEKLREDRLRALGLGVVRWTWAEAQHPGRLAQLLLRAGLRKK